MAIGGLPSSSGAELDKVTLKIDVAASARSRTRRAWSRLQREEVLGARAPRARPWPRLRCCSARARCGCRGGAEDETLGRRSCGRHRGGDRRRHDVTELGGAGARGEVGVEALGEGAELRVGYGGGGG